MYVFYVPMSGHSLHKYTNIVIIKVRSVILFIYDFRFLEQITVCDTSTKEIYHFICNQWLTPDWGDAVARYDLELTKGLQYRYTLRVKSLQKLRDQHIWVSIFTCPRHSTFTRVQRLSCCFAFVMSAMLVDIMFYGITMPEIHEELIYNAMGFDISQLITGVQTCLSLGPISLLTIYIFRTVNPRDPKLEVRYGGDDMSDQSRDTDTDSEWVASDSVPSDSNPSDSRRIESSSSNTSDSDETTSYEDERAIHSTASFRLPWWCVYIAWAITISMSGVSSYVVLMYGLTFGLNRSVAWLMSFLAATTNNIGIMQPLKVAAIVTVMTLLFKAPVQPVADITPRINLGK